MAAADSAPAPASASYYGIVATRRDFATGSIVALHGRTLLVNAFVGAMVGLERSILPAIAEREFHVAARAAILSFIVVFGIT